jgi:hypothetical protein
VPEPFNLPLGAGWICVTVRFLFVQNNVAVGLPWSLSHVVVLPCRQQQHMASEPFNSSGVEAILEPDAAAEAQNVSLQWRRNGNNYPQGSYLPF